MDEGAIDGRAAARRGRQQRGHKLEDWAVAVSGIPPKPRVRAMTERKKKDMADVREWIGRLVMHQ